MLFDDEDSGALHRPEVSGPTFENPILATTAAGYLAMFAAGRAGMLQGIKHSTKIFAAQAKAGEILGGVSKAFKEAQVSAMIAVSDNVPQGAMRSLLKKNMGEHGDIELFSALDEALTTRARIQGIGAPQHGRDLVTQTDAELRNLFKERFKTTERAGFKSMTVDDVLSMDPQQAKKQFGEQGMALLESAMENRLIAGDMALGAGVFKGSSGNVLRTDLATAGSVLKGIKAAANEIQIPVVGVKFGDLMAAPIEHMVGRDNTMRMVRGIEDPTKASVLIGKKLFDIGEEGGVAKINMVADNMRHGTGIFGLGVMGRRGQLPGQKLAETDAGMFTKFTEAVFDISRRQQTTRGPIERARLAYKRRMEGTLVHDEFVNLRDVGARGSNQQALGDILGVHPVTGLPVTPGVGSNPVVRNPNLDKMGLGDKLREGLGFEVKGARYLDKDGVEISGRKLTGSQPAPASQPTLPGENFLREGVSQGTMPVDDFVYKDDFMSKLADTSTALTNRLNDLFGHTFGLGFTPAGNHTAFKRVFGENLGDIIGGAKRAAFAFTGLTVGFEALKYADYFAGRTAGFVTGAEDTTFKPSNMILGAYSMARAGLQDVREATGISDLARGAEEAAPGIVDSTFSNVLRMAAGPVAGLLAKSKVGFAVGSAASVLLADDFTGSIKDTPEDVRDVLSGEKEVAIRKGRYWEFGKQAYEGGQIGYHTQGIVARMRSGYKYTDTLYGSETEYFSDQSSLPTPTNLFGLRNVVEGIKGAFGGQSRMEARHKYQRPYPGSVEEVTQPPAGEDAGYDKVPGAGGMGVPGGGTMPGGVGFGVGDGAVPTMSRMVGGITNSLEYITEQYGIYKFFAETARNTITGRERTSQQLANPDFMASPERAFYDEQLGGLLTLSELPRRFLLSSNVQAQRSAYNPLPNLMPDFLPGSRTEFEEDRDNYIDFHTGDPYGKIKHGEMRLPGEAYERLHRLHSGAPGVYDAMDRYLMLSDVAPGSESHKHYEAIVKGWSMSGALDSYWEKKFNTAQENNEARLQVHNFRMRPSDAIAEKQERGEDLNMLQKGTGFLWEGFTREIAPRFGAAVPLVGNFVEDKLLSTRDAQETYLNREIYDTDEYDWSKPYTTMVRPMVESQIAQDPLTATIAGGITGFMFAANPKSKALFTLAGGLLTGAASSLRALTTGSLQNGYIPDHVQERREVDAYFDKIEYMKYKRLEQGARTMGNFQAAEKFRDLSGRTVASLDYNQSFVTFKRAAMKALSPRERAYFNRFVSAKEEDREDILKYLPGHVKSVYEAAYAMQGDERYALSLMKLQNTTADQKVAEYLTSTGRSAPGEEWAGWSPNVDMQAAHYETATAMGNNVAADIHRSGLGFARMDPVIMGQVDALDLDITEHFEGSVGMNPAQMFSLESELRAAGMVNVSVNNNIILGQDAFSMDVSSSSRQQIRQAFERY